MEGNGFSRFYFRPEDLRLPKDMDLTVPSLGELPPPPAFPDPLSQDWTGGSSAVALNERVNRAKTTAEAWNVAHPLPATPAPETPEAQPKWLEGELAKADEWKAHNKALKTALAGIVAAYDRNNPLRTGDFHRLGCSCMRCAIDAVRITLEAKP